ncbi:MAG: thioesterase family protein [Ornithinimicrobium sp.]
MEQSLTDTGGGSPTRGSGQLAPYRVPVAPGWVDYNGHMSEWAYLLVMGNNSDAFFRYVGIDEAYRAGGASLYTVETHIHNYLEASEGELLTLTLQVLGCDSKRVHVAHRILREDDELIATGEQMLLHVDTTAGRTSVMPEAVQARVTDVAQAHRDMERPQWVGHVMAIPGDMEGPIAAGDLRSEGTG